MKLLLITNILSPYRKYFYDLLNERIRNDNGSFQVLVMSKTEADRKWQYEDYKGDYTRLLKSKSINLKLKDRTIFIHFNKGVIKNIREINPDIIVVAGSWTLPTAMLVAFFNNWLKLGKKIIFWSENHRKEEKRDGKFISTLKDWFKKKFYSRFDGFWYAGKLSLENIQYYINKKKNRKMYFIPNLVNEKVFFLANSMRKEKIDELRNKYNILENEFVIVCPVRLTYIKGISLFVSNTIEFFRNTGCKLIIAGDGEDKELISKTVRDNGLNIELVGELDENEIVEMYAVANLFLLPSLRDANPLTAIEACWAGLPLMLSDKVGNYPELIDEGENGIVFNPKDKENVLQSLREITNKDESWYSRASDLSIEIARKIYSGTKAVDKLVRSLED